MQNYLVDTYLVRSHIKDLQASAADFQIQSFGRAWRWQDQALNGLGDALIALGHHLKSLPSPVESAACEA